MASTTLGIDLAAESSKTGACSIRWEPGRGIVQWARVGTARGRLDNAALVRLARDADAVGVDAPFGWPRRFVSAVADWASEGAWREPWDDEARRALRLRTTDRWIAALPGARPPLSVSADSIGVCAMRACALLHELHGPRLDRVNGPTVEVYPAAALRQWRYDTTGYRQHAEIRARLLASVASGGWLDLGACSDDLVRTDHAFDAFVSALVARAAAVGKVMPVPDELAEDAAIEGWIQLPAVAPAELLG
jgi:predicted nuclease with RNAse H fold